MKDYKIMGINLPLYFALLAILLVAIGMDVLPAGMIGAFAFMMIVGALLDVIGNNTPIVKTFFGGRPDRNHLRICRTRLLQHPS